MNKHIILLIFPLILSGCSFSKKQEKIELENIQIPEVDHEYFEVEKIHINFDDIFNQQQSIYFVYFYSLSCVHCEETKNFIIDFALKNHNIYFVKSFNKIVIKNNVSNTIGVTKVEDIAILGYPSLIKIVNKTLVENVAGKSNVISLLN